MWRFVGFVVLVVMGLAAVFYYKGQAEDIKASLSAKKAEPNRVVSNRIEVAKAPQVQASQAKNVGNIRLGGAIVIPAELKATEELEVTFEVENATASILEILKVNGAEVKAGEPLVKMEDIMPQARLEAQRIQATEVSDSKIQAAENALDVYEKEVARNQKLVKEGAASVADLELSVARREQARQDIIKAKSEKKFEEARLREITQQSQLYEIKSRIPGRIIKIYKKKGSSVRNSEPILHIINDKSLIVEGAFEAGFSRRLAEGMTVVLEPENDQEAKFVFNGHTAAVTGLAIAPQTRFMASSSDDGSVVLWDMVNISALPWARLERGDQRRLGCKCVAISPAVTNDTYLVVAGYADGSIYQWNVKIEANQPPKYDRRPWEKAHDQSVNCIAFRSDGKYLASGSDDRRVALWSANEGKKVYWVQAESNGAGSTHSGAVTSVNFTPDGLNLLTSGTDNAIRRWKLGTAQDGSELEKTVLGRTGDVSRINMADDGKYIFSEHGDELRLLDSKNLEPVSVISSRRQGRFVQFAQLSQNGLWAVTATDQGRNMLIRLPTLTKGQANTSTNLWLQDGSIGAHLTLPEAVRATCSMFHVSPEQSLVFMGCSDNKIRVWELPTAAELTTPLLGKVTFKSTQVESGTGLMRIQASYDNTGPRQLETGKRVTMIVYPDAQDK